MMLTRCGSLRIFRTLSENKLISFHNNIYFFHSSFLEKNSKNLVSLAVLLPKHARAFVVVDERELRRRPL